MVGRRLAVVVPSLVLGLLIAGACVTHRTSLDDLPSRELTGHYTTDDGGSWFRSCGSGPEEPSWWVTFTGRSVARADRARASGDLVPGVRYFVRWNAAVTTGGEVGPQGEGVPALLVRELIELRPAADDDCR
jgi:hypothetical protein